MMNTNRPRPLPTITDLAMTLAPRTLAAWHDLEREIASRTAGTLHGQPLPKATPQDDQDGSS